MLSAFAVVTVADAKTGERICGADLTLSVDGEDFIAEESAPPCDYTIWSGKLDRDMSLLVEAEGYRSLVTFVRVPEGSCGPVTQAVDVVLNPS